MIFIVVKFTTRPDWSDRWLDLVRDFTEATRAEPGNLWFEWSRSVEDPRSSSSSKLSVMVLPRPTSPARTSRGP